MPQVDSYEFQSYYTRIRPVYAQIFNTAHLITGNSDAAEFAVQCAILDCWIAGESNAGVHGFREALRYRTVRAALKARGEPNEFDWNGLRLDDMPVDPILTQLRKEPFENLRILALHYGCGFRARKCAQLCKSETRKVSTLIDRFERRISRKLTPQDKRKFEAMMPKIMREILSKPDPSAPEFSAVFRAFQADAMEARRPSRLPARILRIILTVVLTLICVVGFFLAAVLMQPATVITPAATIAPTPAPTSFESSFAP